MGNGVAQQRWERWPGPRSHQRALKSMVKSLYCIQVQEGAEWRILGLAWA